MNADITVSTEADQLVVAPGYQESERIVGGRRIARYRTDAPIQNFFSIQSARYEVARDQWHGVDLAVYHYAAHDHNTATMIAAMKQSLDVFTEAFSPFQFRQLRILEFPAYAGFAQSFANTIPYSESIGFILNRKDPEDIDMVTYITAHEIGHQWWGHPYATQYHYHGYSWKCFPNQGVTYQHSPLFGYAMDGFGVYGPRGDGGILLKNADLDECHGHFGRIKWDGQFRNMYHYHVNNEFPYGPGCYRGTPGTIVSNVQHASHGFPQNRGLPSVDIAPPIDSNGNVLH